MIGIIRCIGYHDELRHSREEMDRIDFFALLGIGWTMGMAFFFFSVFPVARFVMNPPIIW
jgi:hypothetical protein